MAFRLEEYVLLEILTVFNKQVSIQGISFYVYDGTTFIVASARPLRVISSAVLGGSLREARYIINHSVDKEYNGSDPEEELRREALRLRLDHDVLGMMTAVSVNHTVLSQGRQEDLAVATLCTAGVGNPGVAGEPAGKVQGQYQPGTINLILLIDGNPTDAAMVNAVITATEAKTRALFKAKVSLPDGEPVTGTTTDAIVVACTGRGEPLRYAGTATGLGYLIGRTVYKAVLQGVGTYLLFCSKGGDYKVNNKQKLLN
ncbi:MAG: adenosylcobinamide amidohydrolase [Bacillota bacterium]